MIFVCLYFRLKSHFLELSVWRQNCGAIQVEVEVVKSHDFEVFFHSLALSSKVCRALYVRAFLIQFDFMFCLGDVFLFLFLQERSFQFCDFCLSKNKIFDM